MKGKSCWVAREKIALSKIIRQGHAVVHTIQQFNMSEAAGDAGTQARGRGLLESVISSTEDDAVPVRLFNFSSLSAHVEEPPRLEMEAAVGAMPSPTSEAEPDAPIPGGGLAAQAEIEAQAAAAAADLLARERERVLQEA